MGKTKINKSLVCATFRFCGLFTKLQNNSKKLEFILSFLPYTIRIFED
jgi:hypothetical protein